MTQTPPDLAETSVWADVWNPGVNEWDPNANPVDVYGAAEPSHGDDPTAEPVSESYGQEMSGTVPDPRANLLTDVSHRTNGNGAAPPPPSASTIEHHVVQEVIETGSARVRARTVRVNGNQVETVLMEQNAKRSRALIKVVTSASVIIIGPARQGGNPAFTAAPTGAAGFWYQATGDAVLEVKATAAVSAFGTLAAGAVDVSVWEEMESPDSEPGLV